MNKALHYLKLGITGFVSLAAGAALAVGLALNSTGITFDDGSLQTTAADGASDSCIPIAQGDVGVPITQSGVYCVVENLIYSNPSGHPIDIQADDVTFDLQGWVLDGSTEGAVAEANGIYAFQRTNVVIRNGVIRGFLRAIFLEDGPPYAASRGHLVEDIVADGNTSIGIDVEGSGITLRRNRVVGTGGSTQHDYAFGIRAVGSGNEVRENFVTTTTGGAGVGFGIFLSDADRSVVLGNVVLATTSTGGGSAGVHIANSTHVTARNNIVTTAEVGISFEGSSGKYMGNLTNDISAMAFNGGFAVGINH